MDIDINTSVYMDVDELYYELSRTERNDMLRLLTEDEQPEGLFRIRTLEDQLKVELLQELFKNKSLNELQDIINNK